ncbi:MAG: hypothetical protein R3E01_03510 [Pirellulaceae bacterium]
MRQSDVAAITRALRGVLVVDRGLSYIMDADNTYPTAATVILNFLKSHCLT